MRPSSDAVDLLRDMMGSHTATAQRSLSPWVRSEFERTLQNLAVLEHQAPRNRHAYPAPPPQHANPAPAPPTRLPSPSPAKAAA